MSRTKTLFIPFILWNLIAIVIQFVRLIPAFSSLFPGAYKTEIHFSLIRIFNTFFCNTLQNGIFVSPVGYTQTEIINEPYPIDIPLWYIRDLMVMVIISPFIYWIIKKCKIGYIIALGLAWCLRNLYLPDGGYLSMLITALFFFSWGGFHGINDLNFIMVMRKFRFLTLLYLPIAFFDTLTIFTHYNSYIHNVGILIGVITVVIIVAQMMESRQTEVNPLFINCTFFVYALHKLIIDDVAKILFSILHLPDNTYVMLVFYIIVPIITIVICILLYEIISRKLPAVSKLLTGGR